MSFGSVISFDVAGGTDAAGDVCRRLEVVRHATSFGAVESTIERRAAIPGHGHLPPGLLRLSVGIEHIEDLGEDLDRALTNPAAPTPERAAPRPAECWSMAANSHENGRWHPPERARFGDPG
jgi:hypothetical protein